MPGHLLIGCPLCALPDSSSPYQSPSLLKSWNLCQNLVWHFWRRWSSNYLTVLNRFTKWQHLIRNIESGDIVIICEYSPLQTKWPLARCELHRVKDSFMRVPTVKMSTGTYRQPVNKLVLFCHLLMTSELRIRLICWLCVCFWTHFACCISLCWPYFFIVNLRPAGPGRRYVWICSVDNYDSFVKYWPYWNLVLSNYMLAQSNLWLSTVSYGSLRNPLESAI